MGTGLGAAALAKLAEHRSAGAIGRVLRMVAGTPERVQAAVRLGHAAVAPRCDKDR